MVQSIVTVVECGDAHAYQFTLATRQRADAVHQLPIELVVLAHHCGMNRVNLNDVVGVGDVIARRQGAFGDVTDEGHQVVRGTAAATSARFAGRWELEPSPA